MGGPRRTRKEKGLQKTIINQGEKELKRRHRDVKKERNKLTTKKLGKWFQGGIREPETGGGGRETGDVAKKNRNRNRKKSRSRSVNTSPKVQGKKVVATTKK